MTKNVSAKCNQENKGWLQKKYARWRSQNISKEQTENLLSTAKNVKNYYKMRKNVLL